MIALVRFFRKAFQSDSLQYAVIKFRASKKQPLCRCEVAFLMLFFLSGLQDTDERHDDADNRDNNTHNPDKYS